MALGLANGRQTGFDRFDWSQANLSTEGVDCFQQLLIRFELGQAAAYSLRAKCWAPIHVDCRVDDNFLSLGVFKPEQD